MLSQICALCVHCVYDGDAVFDYPFTLGQISKWDYFHP